MSLDLVAELDAFVDEFKRERVEYALCGGLALGLHGHPRATMDIDFLIRPESLAQALQVATSAGKMTFGLRTDTPREVHLVSKLDRDTSALLGLDLIVVSPALEVVWNGREAYQVGARQMILVSRDGLATMKRIAGRPQDLADLAALEGGR